MKPSPATSVSRLYAIKLLAAEHPGDNHFVGRIEHVLSGRCREFHSGAALLACLAQDQSPVSCEDDPATTSTEPR